MNVRITAHHFDGAERCLMPTRQVQPSVPNEIRPAHAVDHDRDAHPEVLVRKSRKRPVGTPSDRFTGNALRKERRLKSVEGENGKVEVTRDTFSNRALANAG